MRMVKKFFLNKVSMIYLDLRFLKGKFVTLLAFILEVLYSRKFLKVVFFECFVLCVYFFYMGSFWVLLWYLRKIVVLKIMYLRWFCFLINNIIWCC